MFEATDPLARWITRTYPKMYMETTGWGLLCAQLVTKAVGEVICREVKEQFLNRIAKTTRPIGYTGHSYKGSIVCTGDESSLSECKVNVYKVTDCMDEYVMVECTTGIHMATTVCGLCMSYISPHASSFLNQQLHQT